MRKTQLLLFPFFLCSFCSCIGNTKKEISSQADDNFITVDLDACEKEEEIKASYFFDNVKTIALETREDVLINRVRNVIVHDDLILLFDNSKQGDLFVFHLNGAFSHRIGKRGMGSGEYVKIADFSLDKKNNEVYILDNSCSRVMKYKLFTGEFVSSITLDVNRFPYGIQYFNGDLYTDACDEIHNKKELLYKIDINNGTEICSWLNADIYNNGWMEAFLLEDGFFHSKYTDNPKYTNLFMNTVISITEDGIEPYLVVNTKDWASTKDLQELSNDGWTNVFSHMLEKGKSFGICKFVEIKNAVFFSVFIDSRMFNVFKSPEETRVFHRFVDDLAYAGNRISVSKIVCSDENGVYAVSEPFLYADFIGEELDNLLNDDLDKRELLTQLPEDSNPVIFYYEYKK